MRWQAIKHSDKLLRNIPNVMVVGLVMGYDLYLRTHMVSAPVKLADIEGGDIWDGIYFG